jgi:small subunit ribosomal protein S3e
MLRAGQPATDFVDSAVRHVLLRQGVLGVKVTILLPTDEQIKGSVPKQLPDHVIVLPPKAEEPIQPTPTMAPSLHVKTGYGTPAISTGDHGAQSGFDAGQRSDFGRSGDYAQREYGHGGDY